MPPTTRSKSTRAAVDPAAAAAAEAETERRAAAQAAAEEQRRQRTREAAARRQERLNALSSLQHKPDVTVAELTEFMDAVPATFWDFKLWDAATKHFIDTRNFAPLWWYLNEIQESLGWNKMTMLAQVLNDVYDADSTFLLASWTGLRDFLKVPLALPENAYHAYPWWLKHVEYAKDSDVYMRLLMKNGWYVSVKHVTDVYHARPQEMIDATADLIYRLGLREAVLFYYPDSFGYINGDEARERGYAHSTDPNKRALLLALIRKRRGSIIADSTKNYSLLRFLSECLRGRSADGATEANADLLDAFASKFNMKDPMNKRWLSELLRNIIAPVKGDLYARADKQQILRTLVAHIFSRHNLAPDDTCVTLIPPEQSAALADAAAAADAENPYSWTGNEMPAMAFAVWSGNAEAAMFLRSLGAKLKPEMRSLATDPKIIQLFTVQEFVMNRRATRIQRAYKEHMYAPDHPSQTRRTAAWNARTGAPAATGGRAAPKRRGTKAK